MSFSLTLSTIPRKTNEPVLSKVCHGQTDGQTDGRTDKRTDGQTDRSEFKGPRLKVGVSKCNIRNKWVNSRMILNFLGSSFTSQGSLVFRGWFSKDHIFAIFQKCLLKLSTLFSLFSLSPGLSLLRSKSLTVFDLLGH